VCSFTLAYFPLRESWSMAINWTAAALSLRDPVIASNDVR
jgi:hypothetical protein